jgi:hypothetical protein
MPELILTSPAEAARLLQSAGKLEVTVIDPEGLPVRFPVDVVEGWTYEDGSKLAVLPESGQAYVVPPSFEFGATIRNRRLRTVEADLNSWQHQIDTSMSRIRELQQELARLRSAGPRRAGREALRAELLTWPTVIDATFGPAYDPLTGAFIPPSAFVITFLPSAYEGVDLGWSQGRFAVTNPVRLLVDNGSIQPFGSPPWSISLHPHLTSYAVCVGNMADAYDATLTAGDVLGAAMLLEAFAVSHRRRDYYNTNWAREAWAWWQHVVLEQHEPYYSGWLFGGRWNGRRIRVAAPGEPIVDIEEFFGGSLREILHIADARPYVNPDDVAAYRRTAGSSLSMCDACGLPVNGCPCHAGCQGCNQPPMACLCPAQPGHYPPVKGVRVNGVLWTRRPAVGCEGGETECAPPDIGYVGRIGGRLTYWCPEHAPADVRAAFEHADASPEARRQAYEARLIGSPPTRATRRLQWRHPAAYRYCDVCGDVAHLMLLAGRRVLRELCVEHEPVLRLPVLRHQHQHTHANGLTHQHYHEHPQRDVATERINDHADDHLAYQLPRGGPVRRRPHDEIGQEEVDE